MSEVTYAIQNLNNTINQFEANVDVHVVDIQRSTNEIERATQDIYKQIEKFRKDMERGEQKQIAHENIIRIDQLIKERFGNYETIRKTVMGVVRDFDINLVRNSTIQELSEELWMTSSRYWLSYALIAITAWVNNYPDVAKSALAEGGRKDAIKTTLFFCLLNLRFERAEVAKHWFYEYLKTLDPTMLQQEASVMLLAFLDGIFGKDKELEQEVINVIDQWIGIINEDATICEELIASYSTYLANINPNKEFSYESILSYCTNAGELSKSYKEVSKYDVVLALLMELNVEAIEQTDENYKDRLDAVLINLISNFDKEEQELRDQQDYFNAIIQNKGDVGIAAEQHEAAMTNKYAKNNIGKQMVGWAVEDETINPRVRKFAFQNTKAWFKTALERFAVKMQQEFPIEYSLSIDTWKGTSNGQDQAELVENMRNYYETNKFQNMYVNTPNIAALIVFVASIALAFVTPYALIATVIAGVILGYRCYKAFKEYPKRIEAAINALQQTLAEISEFRQYFEENSMKKDEILSETEFI